MIEKQQSKVFGIFQIWGSPPLMLHKASKVLKYYIVIEAFALNDLFRDQVTL